MAEAAANDLALDGLHEDLLRRIIDGFLDGRDAARLACVSKLFKDAVMASKWPPWSPEPHILADGTVCEPLSGRYSAYLRPGDDWARMCQVIADAPAGATVLTMAGEYWATGTMELSRPIYIFGNGATIRRAPINTAAQISWNDSVNAPLIDCTAARGALVGLTADNSDNSDISYRGACFIYEGGVLRLQGCTFMVGRDCDGVFNYRETCPAIIDCKFRGGRTGCGFSSRACGELRQCDVRDCSRRGIYVYGRGPRSALRIEGNVINCAERGVGVWIDFDVDPSFVLGPGNIIHGGLRYIDDDRNNP